MSAVISDCERYRYRLDRVVPGQWTLIGGADPMLRVPLLIGVNPSTADAETNDQTIRKDIGFCQRWGSERFIKGNVFAYRATDVTELATAEDPIGLLTDAYLMEMIAEATVIVPCWGRQTKVPKALRQRFDDVRALLRASGKPLRTFGLTQCDSPLHPLMLSYSTQLEEFHP